ncbi:unnamed protein product [Sphenostylis stenocarpa]|uniref:ADP-ribosyl cyclase/cyclic ADP-ribose hydrolase n=1 Tax=Sphenostylis stenocarpa TaxID=92480 RepID=A0AA86W4Z7_9FABA|nr:unnamed protein product [Sphenostylis stenocarpa]
MASSSRLINTYDVFVSFRGEDTRNNFTGFLFQALCRKGIHAFKDDEDLKKGESIAPELLQAIQGSRLFLTVFSKNYASSIWCLRELAEICNCVETSPRRVIPIFYDVDPSDVRKQSGFYEKAFARHEERFREDKEKTEEVQRWRQALTQVANLSGWDIRNKAQFAEIEQIVQNLLIILGPNTLNLPNDDLVGMESRVEELENLLCLGLVNEVRAVGISGMGGIGKTTLARALYERISHQYDFHGFIDDVSKIYRDSSSLGIQKQLLSQSLKEKNLEICNALEGTCLVWTRLHNVKALVVLDNVEDVEQLKMFTGNRNTMLRECLGGGSRIIIISRDEHVLRTHGVDDVYQVQPLNKENAVELFCRSAFKVNYILSEYEKLAYEVLSHAEGHPLAIEVIGSSLFGRNVSQWRSALGRLKDNKRRNIMDVLRVSFNQLDEIDREIFLDIACFLSDYDEKYAIEVLNFRGFYPEYGIQVLIDKSLITIKYGSICMHRLLRDLGRCIVREKSPKEPIKWSRLWDYQDLYNVMLENQESENLEAIVVKSNSLMINEAIMRADALSKIKHLKLLKLENVKFSGSLNNLSNELGYLTWKQYPFQCLPPSFQPDKLVELVIGGNNIQRLWEGTKPLHNLKRLDLSHSKNLVEMPDVESAVNLEMLDLEGCIQLRIINPSIGLLRKLTFLNLKNCINLHCKRLKYLPDLPSRTDLPSELYYLPDLPFNLIRDEANAGIMIYNCRELVDRDRCTSMSISWMIQIAQANHQCRCFPFDKMSPNFESIIPGSEIPRWFNSEHVSTDNSIIIDASPVAHENYWMGVVCCVIFQIREITSPREILLYSDVIPVDVRKDLAMDDSDHMWLFYLTQQEFIHQCNYRGIPNIDCLKIKFKIGDMLYFRDLMVESEEMEDKVYPEKEQWQMDESVVLLEVKKYGYRWVSEQDLEQSNSIMMHGGNLVTRKRKFLAIDGNK